MKTNWQDYQVLILNRLKPALRASPGSELDYKNEMLPKGREHLIACIFAINSGNGVYAVRVALGRMENSLIINCTIAQFFIYLALDAAKRLFLLPVILN